MPRTQHHVTRYRVTSFCCLALLLASCDGEVAAPISVKLYQAMEAGSETEAPDGFRVISYEGGARSAAGRYFVAQEPVMTEWNILTFREAHQADGRIAVVALLNEYAKRKLGPFSTDSLNVKKPLALQIDGRWADVSPLLATITDKITLYGFTVEEAAKLQQSLKTR